MSADDFTWAVRVTAVGNWAIVGIVIQANFRAEVSYSVGFAGDVAVGGTDSPTCNDLGNHDGFYVTGSSVLTFFTCGNHPLVSAASTYWFGDSSNADNNVWNQAPKSNYSGRNGMAVSWQGKTLPVGGRGGVTMCIRLGSASWTPDLDLSGASASDGHLYLTGSVRDSFSNRVSVFAAFDGNYAELAEVAIEQPSGSTFSVTISLSNWYLTAGPHTLAVFAIDESGMVSSIEMRTIRLDATYGSSLPSGSCNAFSGTATPSGWSPITWTPPRGSPTSGEESSTTSEGVKIWVIAFICLIAVNVAVAFAVAARKISSRCRDQKSSSSVSSDSL
jgi:hypothetical protein